MQDDIQGLQRRLDAVNRARLGLLAEDDALASEEAAIETAFGAATRLAVYGTLGPGKVNHHQIADLGGAWSDAAVRARLDRVGCGPHRGLPAIVLDAAAAPHPLKLLACARLPEAWARLDAFEGGEMQRLLVPLEEDGRVAGAANIYALRRAMMELLG